MVAFKPAALERDRIDIVSAARWLLLVAAVFISLWPGVFMSLSTFDAGFVASGAMEILRGGLPMRDFFVIYGPGQYYLVAAAFAAFGEDLAVLNLLHLTVMALLGGLLAAQGARLCPARARLAAVVTGLAFTAFALCFPPSPGYAAITAAALLVAAVAQLPGVVAKGSATGLLRVSVCLGLAGLVRWDFGVFGFLVLALSWVACRPRSVAPGLVRLAWPALLLFLVFFLPFILISGAARWWEEVPWFHLREFREWRALNFIGPHAEMLDNALDVDQMMAVLPSWLAFLLPFVLIVLSLPLAVWRVLRQRGQVQAPDLLALGLSLLVLALLNQQRVRTGLEQGFPALVVSLPLAFYVPRLLPVGLRQLAVAMLGLAFLLMLVAVVQALPAQLLSQPQELARYSGWRVSGLPGAAERARNYRQLVQRVADCVPEGQRLFSGALDTSRLWVNDPLLYFLSDRRAATRWIEMEPGLTNAPQRQAALVQELVDHAPPCVVLRDVKSTEPNRTSFSNGPSAVDEFLRERYVPAHSVGSYQVWRKR